MLAGRRLGLKTPSFPARKHSTKLNNVLYVTDIEGDYEYWTRFLDKSDILTRTSPGAPLTLREGFHFVYGGDVCDRGAGDLRILRDLVSLKERNTDRVHFVLGNRDINKLRVPFNLHRTVLTSRPQCYWLRADHGGEHSVRSECRTSKLQWMLGKTMNAPISFPSRLAELRVLRGSHSVSDEDVTQSYLDSLDAEGFRSHDPYHGLLLKYLYYGQIAVCLGDTLFVHGAIHDHNFGWIPPYCGNKSHICTDFRSWMVAINLFVRSQINDYINRADAYMTSLRSPSDVPMWLWDCTGGYLHPQPASGLLQYGMSTLPDRTPNPSVIYASYLRNGVPCPPSDKVLSWLAQGGVRRVVVGHQPHGDAPWTMTRHLPHHRIEIVSADNSYADQVRYQRNQLRTIFFGGSSSMESEHVSDETLTTKAFEEEENLNKHIVTTSSRGKYAFSELVVRGLCFSSATPSVMELRGRLSSGLYFKAQPSATDQSLVGKQVQNDWYVKSVNVDIPGRDPKVLLSKSLHGHVFKNLLVDMKDLHDYIKCA